MDNNDSNRHGQQWHQLNKRNKDSNSTMDNNDNNPDMDNNDNNKYKNCLPVSSSMKWPPCLSYFHTVITCSSDQTEKRTVWNYVIFYLLLFSASFSDRSEPIKELTEEEKQEIQKKENSRLAKTTTKPNYPSPRKERALKIYTDSTSSSSTWKGQIA